jgi:hypothetical protein
MSGLGRRLIHGSLVALVATAAAGHPRAAGSNTAVLQRFLTMGDSAPTGYRALRHLEAKNDHFESSAWMDVWTDADRATGFRYTVVSEGGSEYIRSHVFAATLEMERKMWESGDPDRAAFNEANYIFEDRGERCEDGLAGLSVKPRRKDLLLVEGSIFLRPEDGELMRIEGHLSRPPSFWTRKVEIVRRYQRIAGVRMPIDLESVANVLVAGRSTFRMSYDYESVNGQRVGAPQVRAAAPPLPPR